MKTKVKAVKMYAVWNIESTGKLDIIPAHYGASIKIGECDSVKSVPMFRGTLEACQEYVNKV